ncbi:O-antigen ligase family protein [Desulfopila aestuarii]|uniref:O-antigen ligase n=1 Tax=Desulfopila aestuarii DSM 18488 TaxID=1121416 RepID=A0A1M7XVG5_9BACT|nr:O-antigen ligase family protein [Desulfopila aestuarii]SHO42567.1 O-antigen ligase [Desulfopila aestuarii DSM 18488]
MRCSLGYFHFNPASHATTYNIEMNLASTLQDQLHLFRQLNIWEKSTNILIFIWLISIPAKNSLYEISTGLIVLTAIVHCAIVGRNSTSFLDFLSKYSDIALALTTIIVSMIISNSFSELTNHESWIAILKFIYRYIFMLFAWLYLYEQKMFSKYRILVYILLSLSFYSITGILEGFYKMGSDELISSFVYNRNPFGLVMLAGIITASISLQYDHEHRKSHKKSFILLITLLCSFILALLFSQSRSSWIAATIFLFMMAINNKHLLLVHRKSVALLLTTSLAMIFFHEPLANRFISIFQFSDPLRITIWSNAVSLIQEKPIVGHGMIDYRHIGIPEFGGTHNSILEILLFLGVTGLLSFSTVTVIITKEIIHRKRYEFLFAMLSFFLISQFNLSILGNKIFLSTLVVFLFFIFSIRIPGK